MTNERVATVLILPYTWEDPVIKLLIIITNLLISKSNTGFSNGSIFAPPTTLANGPSKLPADSNKSPSISATSVVCPTVPSSSSSWQ